MADRTASGVVWEKSRGKPRVDPIGGPEDQSATVWDRPESRSDWLDRKTNQQTGLWGPSNGKTVDLTQTICLVEM